MARRYRAFISYSWADKEWASWLHRTLELYRTPKALIGRETPLGPAPASLHPIFKDREEEAAGHGIGAAIEAAMGASDFLIVLCSPRSAQSQWVNREVAWFKTHKDKTRVLALIVDGEPLASYIAGREAEECFPKTLTHKIGADLQPTDEQEDIPLAADARKSGDGKRGARLKLAAALLGVGLDDLVRRDERRRAVRRRIITGAAFGLSAAMSVLALVAATQRDAAVTARSLAQAAQKDAEFQRDEAQSLTEFMLTDLRQRLDAVGRLDILDAVAKRLLQSYDKQDLAKLNPDALGRRARVQLLLGEVENSRGNLDVALARYKEAAATTKELLAREPDVAQRIFDHAQSVFWVGYIAWQRGDAKEAKKYWMQYKDYADRLVAIDPDKDEWQMEQNYALSNLGTLAMDQGEAAEAESSFRTTLAVTSQLLERRPGDLAILASVGQAYAWLADSLYEQIKIPESLKVRRAEIDLYSHIGAGGSGNAEIVTQELIARYSLANGELASNHLDQAFVYASDAQKLTQSLLMGDPKNAAIANRSAYSLSILAEALLHLDRTVEARLLLNQAITISDRLIALDASVVRSTGNVLAQPKLVLAQLEAHNEDSGAAVTLFNEVAAALGALISEGIADRIMVRRYCAALAGRARLDESLSSDWTEIIARLAPTTAKLGPEALALLAEAYARTGKNEAARTIATKLYAAGFRHPDFMSVLAAFPGLAGETGQVASGQ